MFKKFDIYVLKQIFIPSLVGLIIVSTLLLGDKLYGLLKFLYSGIPVKDLVEILSAYLPVMMTSAIPAALLIGISLGLTTLIKNREIQTVNLIGVKKKRIILPLIILGIIASLITFFFQEYVIPKKATRANQLIQQIFNTPSLLVNTDSFLKIDNKFIYINESTDLGGDVKELKDITIFVSNYNDKWPQIITAPRATQITNDMWELQPDENTGEKVNVYILKEGENGNIELMQAEKASFTIPVSEFNFISDSRFTPEEFTTRELYDMINMNVSGVTEQADTFTEQFRKTVSKEVIYNFHLKTATVLMPIIITILAAALSVRTGKNGSFMGLLIAAIIVFCTIVSAQWMKVLVENTDFNPVLAAYLPAGAFLIIGIALLIKE